MGDLNFQQMIDIQDFATLTNKYHPHSETVIAMMHQPNKKVLPEKTL